MWTLLNWLKNYSLLLLWVLAVVWMASDSYWFHPPEPAASPYGRNVEGELITNVLWSSFELALLYLILRPWSFNRSLGRVGVTLILFWPWLLLFFLVTIHSGNVSMIHGVWLLLINTGLSLLLVALAIEKTWYLITRKRSP